MKHINLLLFTLLVSMIGCGDKATIEGTWIVKSVMVGEEEMTPNGRWMRFNADATQQSGNGWRQHSIGTWELTLNKLKIINSNGLNDPNEAFDIDFNEHQMTWKRMEEGQAVVVSLEKIEALPLTYGDQLLGLWELEKAVGNGSFFSESDKTNDYLFIRWDNRFVINTSTGRYSGVYQVHGHKSEVALFPYDDLIGRSHWDINFDQNAITLRKLNSDSLVTRKFRRIHDFPQ